MTDTPSQYFPRPSGSFANQDGGYDEEEEDFLDSLSLPKATSEYRATTIGKALLNSVCEISDQHQLPKTLCDAIMEQFDRCILNALEQRSSARLFFKASKMESYSNLDGFWCFKLKQVEFRQYHCLENVPSLLIKMFDGRVPVTRTRSNQQKKRYKGQVANDQ